MPPCEPVAVEVVPAGSAVAGVVVGVVVVVTGVVVVDAEAPLEPPAVPAPVVLATALPESDGGWVVPLAAGAVAEVCPGAVADVSVAVCPATGVTVVSVVVDATGVVEVTGVVVGGDTCVIVMWRWVRSPASAVWFGPVTKSTVSPAATLSS